MSRLPILTNPSPLLPPNPTFYTPTPSRQLLTLVRFLEGCDNRYDFAFLIPIGISTVCVGARTEDKKRRHFRSLLTKSITGVDEFLDTSLIGRGPNFGTEEQKREASRVIAVHLLFSLVLLMLEGSDNFIKAGVTGDTLNLQFHESFCVKTMAEMMSSCRIM